MPKNKSNASWLKEHVEDVYVHQAQKAGYRARAAYKLLEINKKDKLIRPGVRLADLGAAPGSWSQVASLLVGKEGHVFALDQLAIDPIVGVTFIQGDFCQEHTVQKLIDTMGGQALDLVISDMAPNITGMRTIDQARSAYLAECALDFAKRNLKPGGHFLVKVFQGSEFQRFLNTLRTTFTTVTTRKPLASRDRSKEIYLLGRALRLQNSPINLSIM